MNKIYLLSIIIFLFFSSAFPQNEIIKKGDIFYLSNTIIVKVKESTIHNGEELRKAISSKTQTRVISAEKIFNENLSTLNKGEAGLSGIYILKVDGIGDPDETSKRISKIKDIEWAEPKYIHTPTTNNPNDSLYVLGLQRNL